MLCTPSQSKIASRKLLRTVRVRGASNDKVDPGAGITLGETLRKILVQFGVQAGFIFTEDQPASRMRTQDGLVGTPQSFTLLAQDSKLAPDIIGGSRRIEHAWTIADNITSIGQLRHLAQGHTLAPPALIAGERGAEVGEERSRPSGVEE